MIDLFIDLTSSPAPNSSFGETRASSSITVRVHGFSASQPWTPHMKSGLQFNSVKLAEGYALKHLADMVSLTAQGSYEVMEVSIKKSPEGVQHYATIKSYHPDGGTFRLDLPAIDDLGALRIQFVPKIIGGKADAILQEIEQMGRALV